LLPVLALCCQCCVKGQTQQNEQTPQQSSVAAKVEQSIPQEAEKLILAYPLQIIDFEAGCLVFADSSRLLFDDEKEKSTAELIETPDIQDMFYYSYQKGEIDKPAKFHDAGRIRNDDFFKKIYGNSAAEVQKNLTTIVWCPKLAGQKLQVTTVNDVSKHLLAISAELDEHPEWKDILRSAGAFTWRSVRGSSHLSAHSFGIAVDLNTKYSHYWQWDCGCTSEDVELSYRNKIPQGIVDVFERHGFIWGGKWYHYDTMHFEYRPELLSVLETDKKGRLI
jgi:hypothetical protein